MSNNVPVFGSLPKLLRAIREAERGRRRRGGPGRWGRLRGRARSGEETAAGETAWSAMRAGGRWRGRVEWCGTGGGDGWPKGEERDGRTWIRRRPYQEKWAELGRLDQVTSRTTQPIEAHVRPGPPAANLIVSSHRLMS